MLSGSMYQNLLLLCVYLPYECDMFYDDYIFYLNKIKIFIESANTPYVFVLGDFNADIQSDSVFGSELVEICNLNLILLIDYTSIQLFYFY